MGKIYTNIYVHTGSQGGVDYLIDGDESLRKVEQATDLYPCLPTQTRSRIRMVGSPLNAKLLLELYERYVEPDIVTDMQVCSPQCFSSRRLSGGAAVWETFAAPPLSPWFGGWHSVTAIDIASFRLAAAPPGRTADLFEAHPLAPALRLLRGGDPYAMGSLIGLIIDPRWFTDPNKPDQCCRLHQYLGIYPQAFHAAQISDWRVRGADRYALVETCWAGTQGRPDDWETAPGAFLWRHMARIRSHRRALATSRLFLMYLRNVWLQLIYGRRREVFIPEYFFKRPDEAAMVRSALPELWKRPAA